MSVSNRSVLWSGLNQRRSEDAWPLGGFPSMWRGLQGAGARRLRHGMAFVVSSACMSRCPARSRRRSAADCSKAVAGQACAEASRPSKRLNTPFGGGALHLAEGVGRVNPGRDAPMFVWGRTRFVLSPGPPDWNRTSIPRLGGMCTIHCATGRRAPRAARRSAL